MKKLKALASAILLMLASTSSLANSNAEFNGALRFNFSNPGAAQLGLAGAFTAKADDASAALANPAGLVRTDRQALIEYRHFGFDSSFVSGGTLSIRYSGLDQNGSITADQPVFGRASANTNGLSFAGYADNSREHGLGWSIFHASLANYENRFQTRGASFNLELPFIAPGAREVINLNPSLQSGRFEVDSYGAALAKRIGSWSFGITMQRQSIDLISADANAGISFRNLVVQRAADHDWTYSAGALWRAGNNHWGVGLQYRGGAEFATSASLSREQIAGNNSSTRAFSYTIQTPSQWNAGFFFKPNDHWTLLADVARIDYSRLSAVQDIYTLGTTTALSLPNARDGWEYRVGVEHLTSLFNRPLYLRLGAWSEPDASLAFRNLPSTQLVLTGPETAGLIRSNELNDYFLFRARDRELHKTFGIGYLWSNLQLDLAYDHSTPVQTGSLSLIFLF